MGTTRFIRAAALAVGLAFAATGARAATYSQGFETDVTDWSAGTTRVPSGTNGIPSAAGGFHAQVTTNFTRWGGYNSVFPTGGYTTSLDIYLNVGGGASNDTRFDFTSAINNAAGAHLRDFAFNGGFYSDATGPGAGTNRFVFSASNSTGRSNSFPKNPARDPFAVVASGWYTFQHVFYNNGGLLAADLSILDASDTVLHTWTLNTTDAIAGVGGNRYAWFPNNEFTFLAIDNAFRSDPAAADTAVPLPSVAAAGLALIPAALIRRRRAAVTTD